MASAKRLQHESPEEKEKELNSTARLGKRKATRATSYYESSESSPERKPAPAKRKKIDSPRGADTNCAPRRVKGWYYYESSESEEVRERSPARRQRARKETATQLILRDRDQFGKKNYCESSEQSSEVTSKKSNSVEEPNLSDRAYELDLSEQPLHQRVGELRDSSIFEKEDCTWPCTWVEKPELPNEHWRPDETSTSLKKSSTWWTNYLPALPQDIFANPCFLPKTPTSAPRSRQTSRQPTRVSSRRQSVASPNSLSSEIWQTPKDQTKSSRKKKSKMAPSYRNQNRRQNRTGVIDHDIYEGIPVRQWRRENVTVAPPPSQDSTNNQNDIWAVELPHGMPKDSHLLPQHSQDLLRAARSGRIYKRPTPVEEEEADPEIILGDKPEKKEEDPKDRGFVAKAWKAVPRHLDLTDNDFLAKKRKNLVPKKPVAAPVIATMTKTTVKRVDAAGNEYVQDVILPHGQQVEGEVLSQIVIPDPNAGLLAVQPTPPKRKSGSSKKKLKGPGRGRKKKPLVAPTSVPAPALVDGAAQIIPPAHAMGPDGVKIEADTSVTPTNIEDTEMGDGSIAASDDDDDDDDDGDDGEDGDEGDDDEGSDVQASPAKRPRTASPGPKGIPPIESIPGVTPFDAIMGGTEFAGPARLFPERERVESRLGSPLKTVALTVSAVTSPQVSPTFRAPVREFPVSIQQSQNAKTEIADIDEVMQQDVTGSVSITLSPPPPEPTQAEVVAEKETLQEEEEEGEEEEGGGEEEEEEAEEMLLDLVNNAGNAQVGASKPHFPDSEPPATALLPSLTPVEIPRQAENLTELDAEDKTLDKVASPTAAAATAPKIPEPLAPVVSQEISAETTSRDPKPADTSPPEPDAVEPVPSEPTIDDDDDDYPDLLGGLEKSLERKD